MAIAKRWKYIYDWMFKQ